MLKRQGFTLVELLVVMAILGVLTTLTAGGFRSAQIRGRDAERKSDLRQISEALELFVSDYGHYPSDVNGQMVACPFDAALDSGTPCTWGSSEMTDSKTVYFKTLPADPVDEGTYFYRVVPGSNNQKFQLFARLENDKDPDLISSLPYLCGKENCNFAITSTNTTALE
jgi:type II secretion system protein G